MDEYRWAEFGNHQLEKKNEISEFDVSDLHGLQPTGFEDRIDGSNILQKRKIPSVSFAQKNPKAMSP